VVGEAGDLKDDGAVGGREVNAARVVGEDERVACLPGDDGAGNLLIGLPLFGMYRVSDVGWQ
jgi:hypothetical protein